MDDRTAGLALLRDMGSVSRETEARLDMYAETLRRWQGVKNLVGPETLERLWTRHIADSAQALAVLPNARRWIDLGSGAGLPGLVTAILLAGGGDVTLVEANGRKCAFLRAAARACGVEIAIRNQRIEDFVKGSTTCYDAVSARALAPLDQLLRLSAPLIADGAVGVFHKGQDVDSELTDASTCWNITVERIPSRIAAGGALVIVRSCTAKTA